jgi:hypothetical protein
MYMLLFMILHIVFLNMIKNVTFAKTADKAKKASNVNLIGRFEFKDNYRIID